MRKTWKRALAMVCTAAMVVTGVNWPIMNAEAASYSTVLSESGYEKAAIKSAVSADNNWSEGEPSKVFDGNIDTIWHSHYDGGDGSGSPIGNTTASDNNWIYVTLEKATDIAGVVYVPRKTASDTVLGNGTFKTFKVMVSKTEDGTDDWTEVDIAEVNGTTVTTSGYENDPDGHYVTVSYTIDTTVTGTNKRANNQELIFKEPQKDVKRVKFVAKETDGYATQLNQFMTAAELCVLKSGEKYVADTTLAANAVANSYMGSINAETGAITGAYTNDGPVSWAFDDENHWWHSKYGYNADYEHGVNGTPSESNPVYMATGFDEATYVSGFYYESRGGNSDGGRIQSYTISTANLEDPTIDFLDPTDASAAEGEGTTSVSDVAWEDVYTVTNGELSGNPQTLEIKFDHPVLATHIKLTVTSVTGNYVMAKRIKVSEMKPKTLLRTRIDDVEENVINKTVEINEILAEATVVAENSSATINEIDVQIKKLEAILDDLSAERIELSKSELNLRCHQDYSQSTVLSAKVYPLITDQAVLWNSDNTGAVTVDENGIVKAIGVGTAKITATAVEDPSVTAECQVTVTAIENENSNIALGKTPSTNATIADGTIGMLNDGNTAKYIDLGKTQAGRYVQLDLGKVHDVDALRLYRYYIDGRSYYGTVVALAESEEDFSNGTAVVVWNADSDNVHGFGKGTDYVYQETANGFNFVTSETVPARYARVYTYGSSENAYDHIMELQVYGREQASEACAIERTSISLDGMIDLNFYVNISDEKANDAVVKLTLDGKVSEYKVSTLPAKTVDDVTYRVATQKVAAAQMTEEVKAELLVNDAVVSKATQTVKGYADQLLKVSETQSALVSLVKAMLHYGAYAQIHFNVNTGNLANAGLASADLDTVTSVTVPTGSWEGTINGEDPVSSASLLLKSGTTLRYILNSKLEAVLDECKYSINGTSVELKTAANGVKYVEYENIPAAKLDDAYTLTVTYNEQAATVTYGPYDYISAAITSNGVDDTVRNTAKALYLYNVAANAYFNR